ncbi:MAG: Gfo/Idh/MocA family oxidoreductase [Lentisphaeria bacterium]
MGIKLGICGVGAFADNFIPLFKAHPLVDGIVLCDLDAAKLQAKADKFGLPRTCPSLEKLCESEVDAIAIYSQNWMHGPQAVQALKAGKDVYSAVPSAISMEQITELVKTVEQTHRIYMVGETSYYYPQSIYCRDRFRKGDFGRIVYAEGEYYHDFDHGLYDVFKWRGGDDWKKYAGSPPMHYPTHSTSMIVSVTGAHMTQVSCLGVTDQHEDGLYRRGVNLWDNVFSDESALFRMSDGSVCRINEFRRVGYSGPGERGSIYGTLGSFELQANGSVWVTKKTEEMTDLTELLKGRQMAVDEVEGDMAKLAPSDAAFFCASAVHPVERLPKAFRGLPNGHCGSHQFLVDDFVKACVNRQLPPTNVWQAARYLVPGLIAHESALKEGQVLPVPDFGDAPASW